MEKDIKKWEKRFFSSRIKFCRSFVNARAGKCNGYRHRLMVILASALMPIRSPAIAKEEMLKFSSEFLNSDGTPNPLEKEEIDAIINTITKKGAYHLRNDKVCEWLGIDREEYDRFALSQNKKENRETQKNKNKEKKDLRNQIIINAISSCATYKEASMLAKCSERTVGSVWRNYRNKHFVSS